MNQTEHSWKLPRYWITCVRQFFVVGGCGVLVRVVMCATVMYDDGHEGDYWMSRRIRDYENKRTNVRAWCYIYEVPRMYWFEL